MEYVTINESVDSKKGVASFVMDSIRVGLYVIFVLALLYSVFCSFKSHRSNEPRERGLYSARMNISLGIMLIILAVIQMLVFSGSTVRVIVGAVFMVIGCFNIFAGIRNHGYFTRMKS